MGIIKFEQGDVYFDSDIDYPTVVLLHAGGSSHRQWRKTRDVLDSSIRCIAPDLWGFGSTDPWPGDMPLTHDIQANLVAAVIKEAANPPCIVVGHSYGGATALRLALSQPDLISGLILIEPIVMPILEESSERELFAEYRQMAEGFLQLTDQGQAADAWKLFLDYRNGVGTWGKLPEEKRANFLKDTQSTVEGLHSNLNNPTSIANIESISLPTKLLCGSRTTLPDRRVAELIANHLPNSEFVDIPNAGHMSPFTHPTKIADVISAFSAQLARH